MKDAISIDKYITDIVNGQVRFYAVKGKTKYLMPKCHESMYDNEHLAILKVERDEYVNSLFSLNNDEEYYIPLRTDHD